MRTTDEIRMPLRFFRIGCLLMGWLWLFQPKVSAQTVDEYLSLDGEHIGVGEDSLSYAMQSYISDLVEITRLEIWVRKDSGGGNIGLVLMGSTPGGEPDTANVLYQGNVSSPGNNGVWIVENNLSIPVVPTQKYFLGADGWNHPGGSGYSAVGISNASTDSGEDMVITSDGGMDWDTVPGVRLAIRVLGNPCPQSVDLGLDSAGFCSGQNLTIDPGPGFVSYSWSTGATSQSITVDTPGVYWVTAFDTTFCASTDTQYVTEYPLPDPGLDKVYKNCEGDEISIALSGNFVSYQWYDGSTASFHNFSTAGYYYVLVTDSNNCVAGDTFLYQNFPVSVIQFNVDTSICENDVLILNAGSGYTAYDWSDGSSDSLLSVQITGDYSVEAVDSNGCTIRSDTATVNVFPHPPAPTITQVDKELTSSFGFTYQWYFNGTILPGDTLQTLTVAATGQYTVEITNGFGCPTLSDPIEVIIDIDPGKIPNAYSPNGDGVNDIFYIENIEYIPEAELVIINRWGQEVYRKAGYDNTWGGDNGNGGKLPDGDYFYLLDLKDGTDLIRGSVHIHR